MIRFEPLPADDATRCPVGAAGVLAPASASGSSATCAAGPYCWVVAATRPYPTGYACRHPPGSRSRRWACAPRWSRWVRPPTAASPPPGTTRPRPPAGSRPRPTPGERVARSSSAMSTPPTARPSSRNSLTYTREAHRDQAPGSEGGDVPASTRWSGSRAAFPASRVFASTRPTSVPVTGGGAVGGDLGYADNVIVFGEPGMTDRSGGEVEPMRPAGLGSITPAPATPRPSAGPGRRAHATQAGLALLVIASSAGGDHVVPGAARRHGCVARRDRWSPPDYGSRHSAHRHARRSLDGERLDVWTIGNLHKSGESNDQW